MVTLSLLLDLRSSLSFSSLTKNTLRCFLAFLFLCSQSFVAVAATKDRTVSPYLGVDCPLGAFNCQTFGQSSPYTFVNNVVYVTSDDVKNNNTAEAKNYRMYWSTVGAPTLLITEVNPNATSRQTHLDWEQFVPGRIEKNSKFLHLWEGRYVGIALVKLYEFNDVNNTGKISGASECITHDLSSYSASWYNASFVWSEDGSLLGTFVGSLADPHDFSPANITIQVRAHATDSRADEPPQMLVVPSSISVRVILDDFPIHFNHSRFAVEFVLASNDSASSTPGGVKHYEVKDVTDEYTPGLFTIEKVAGWDTYMQWKPIVYTHANDTGDHSTRSQTGNLFPIANLFDNGTGFGVPFSLLVGLEGIQDNGTTLVRFNVSFGTADDGFYHATSFQEWSCELGLGKAPVEQTPTNVKLILGLVFGILAALILAGVGYVGYVKLIKNRRGDTLISPSNPGNVPSYSTLE